MNNIVMTSLLMTGEEVGYWQVITDDLTLLVLLLLIIIFLIINIAVIWHHRNRK